MLVDGQDTDFIQANDRGLAYGDGLFETILLKDGQLKYWHEHANRLCQDAQKLSILPPDLTVLESEVLKLVSEHQSGIVKIILTRGSGGRGYNPHQAKQSRRILSFYDCPNYPESYSCTGIDIVECQTKLGHQPLLAGIKHLNRLEQVLARAEWQDEYQEGLVCDIDGHVIEGTFTNLFMIRDGDVLTPKIDQCGVKGIQRQHFLNHSDCKEDRISISDLVQAEACFVCNSVIGFWPVKSLKTQDGKLYTFDVKSALTAIHASV